MKQTTFVAMLLLGAAGCGSTGDAEPSYEVATSVVADEATQDISVWAPDAEGSWPIVFALHGFGADRSRWDVTGPALASQGVVVFAPDYRTEPQHMERDVECGWRYVASIAKDHGGDLDQPITFVGHSFGATGVLIAGLDEAAYAPGGTYDGCLTAAPMPDVIVPVSGCHYEYLSTTVDFAEKLTGMTNRDVSLVVAVGTEDEECEPWQSQDAADDLLAEGYAASLVSIQGADHTTLIYKDFVDGEPVTIPDHPAGDELVRTILDAIEAARP